MSLGRVMMIDPQENADSEQSQNDHGKEERYDGDRESAFMNCHRETSTPILLPVSTTITFAAAPRIVALPANVGLVTRASHRLLLPTLATNGERSMTAGTLLIRLDRMAQKAVSPGMLVRPDRC